MAHDLRKGPTDVACPSVDLVTLVLDLEVTTGLGVLNIETV